MNKACYIGPYFIVIHSECIDMAILFSPLENGEETFYFRDGGVRDSLQPGKYRRNLPT